MDDPSPSVPTLMSNPRLPWWRWPIYLWVLFWLLANGFDYLSLTWHLVSVLHWWVILQIINPEMWIWLVTFGGLSIITPLNMLNYPRVIFYAPETRRNLTIGMILFPPIMFLALTYIGPYFYPVYPTADGSLQTRIIPFWGGRGYFMPPFKTGDQHVYWREEDMPKKSDAANK
jgi:hypothetical protein